jgi:hypothetical protein
MYSENNILFEIDPNNFDAMIALYKVLKYFILNGVHDICENTTALKEIEYLNYSKTIKEKLSTIYIRLVNAKSGESEESDYDFARNIFSRFMHDLYSLSEKINVSKDSEYEIFGKNKKEAEKARVKSNSILGNNKNIENRQFRIYNEIEIETEKDDSIIFMTYSEFPYTMNIDNVIIYCFDDEDEEIKLDELNIKYQVVFDQNNMHSVIGSFVFFLTEQNKSGDDSNDASSQVAENLEEKFIFKVEELDNLKKLKTRRIKLDSLEHLDFSQHIKNINPRCSTYFLECMRYIFRVLFYIEKSGKSGTARKI